ncbi:MAG: hypothetical protein JXR19_09510 [Bacteroidia bacterium]
MSIRPKTELKVGFTTNSFSENPMNVIIMATAAGFSLMVVFILLGAPILLTMAALFGGILWVYGYKIGETTYEIYEHGIYQHIKNFIPYRLSKKTKERFIKWEDIRYFKHDHDMTRELKEYEFIKLYLRKAPGQIWITDQKNRAGFEKFRDVFIESAQIGVQKPTSVAHQKSDIPKSSEAKKTRVKQRKGFYSSIAAKLITIVLVLLTVALFVYGATSGMRVANWFRLAAILLPGCLYMLYRVFFTRTNNP